MAAIAKFISYDGGIAFSDSVVKFQKRSGDAKLFPLGEIDSINVRRPQQDNRGFIRLQTSDGKLYRIFFEEEQYSQALAFKKQLDEQLVIGAAPAPEPAAEPAPEPVREEPVDSLPAERPQRRPSRRRREAPVQADVEDRETIGEDDSGEEDIEEPSLLRRWWFWLIVVLLVVAIAAAAALVVIKFKTDRSEPSAPVNTSAITIPVAVDVPGEGDTTTEGPAA